MTTESRARELTEKIEVIYQYFMEQAITERDIYWAAKCNNEVKQAYAEGQRAMRERAGKQYGLCSCLDDHQEHQSDCELLRALPVETAHEPDGTSSHGVKRIIPSTEAGSKK